MSIPKLPKGHTLPQCSRGNWLKIRRGYIGASEVGALFGESNWDSLYSLWAEKSKLTNNDMEPSIAMKRGSRFEDALAEEVRESTGWLVHQWPQTTFVRHDSESLGCTPDAILETDDGLAMGDFKMSSEWNKRHWENEPPGVYQMQMQAQMAVTGIRKAYLLVAFGLNDEVTPVEVPYHQGFQEELLLRVKEFWRCVNEDEEPEVDGKKATFKALREVYPDADGTAVVLTGDDEMAARDYVTLGEQIKDLSDLQDLAKARLMLAMKSATYASTPNGMSFSYKSSVRKSIDSKLLRQEHPDIAELMSRYTPCRTLRTIKNIPMEV